MSFGLVPKQVVSLFRRSYPVQMVLPTAQKVLPFDPLVNPATQSAHFPIGGIIVQRRIAISSDIPFAGTEGDQDDDILADVDRNGEIGFADFPVQAFNRRQWILQVWDRQRRYPYGKCDSKDPGGNSAER